MPSAGGEGSAGLLHKTPRYATRDLPAVSCSRLYLYTNQSHLVRPTETILVPITMKHSSTAFLSLAVLSHTLGVLADDKADCYAIDAVNETTYTFNTLNWCANNCGDAGYSVFAAQGSRCSCLDTLPSNDKKRDASECNVACPGYALENCESVQASFEGCCFLCRLIER